MVQRPRYAGLPLQAALLPVAVGLNTTLIVQLAPTARLAGQLCVCTD
jgi:hypothetical protein